MPGNPGRGPGFSGTVSLVRWRRGGLRYRAPVIVPRGEQLDMARYSTLAPGVAAFASTPLAGVLGTLVRRWSVLTLEALADGRNRFNELQRRLGGITHKVLIDTLRSLQRDGFVHGPLTGDGVT